MFTISRGFRKRVGLGAVTSITSAAILVAQPARSAEESLAPDTDSQNGREIGAARLTFIRSVTFSYEGDAQRLTRIDQLTGERKLAGFARISPRDGLGTFTMSTFATRNQIPGDTLGVLTAMVEYKPGATDPKLHEGLQLVPGKNAVFLRYDGKIGDPSAEQLGTNWKVFVVSMDTPEAVRTVRMHHRESHANDAVKPPATARFEWLENGEGWWIMCDLGCCHVGGGPGF
jgi:hypothetical protein